MKLFDIERHDETTKCLGDSSYYHLLGTLSSPNKRQPWAIQVPKASSLETMLGVLADGTFDVALPGEEIERAAPKDAHCVKG